MSTTKTTIVEKVLPNDEDLGRRNCRWRELIKKYEQNVTKETEDMDIDTVLDMLDQDMSSESSVRDIEEASSEQESVEEDPEDIKQQLRVAVPSRKRAWEENGLKEILDDQEYRMLSQEKVENWLRNHMYSITGHYNVRYEKQQVTTVTETCMDADAESLYSVDTAQYIRSNKQLSNKVKVTTMIKQYAVTSSIHHGRYSSVGCIQDETAPAHRLSLPPLGRLQSKSESSCDVTKPTPEPTAKIISDHHQHQRVLPLPSDPTRRTRRKVFKKTLPKKRTGGDRTSGADPIRGPSVTAQQLRHDQGGVYEMALEQCARMKKVKARRLSSWKVTEKQAHRVYSSTSSSGADNRHDDSDSNDVFSNGPSMENPSAARKKPFCQSTEVTPPQSPHSLRVENSPPAQTSPSEREILEPFQSITLSATKRQKLHTAAPIGATGNQDRKPRKPIGIQQDGSYHDEGLVIFRPKAIQPHLAASERIRIRMEDLTLDGVTKQRHLVKFRDFNYRIHPNSTVCFYPSESDTDEETKPVEGTDNNEMENSFDDDDPILTFDPRKTKLLNVVEVPYRRRVS